MDQRRQAHSPPPPIAAAAAAASCPAQVIVSLDNPEDDAEDSGEVSVEPLASREQAELVCDLLTSE